MKLKESKDISLYGKLPLIFILCCAATIILRTVQLFFFIDRETGFFSGGTIVNGLLYAVLAVVCSVFALTAYMSVKTAEVDLFMKKDKAFRTVSTIFAAAFIFDAMSAFFSTVDSFGGSSYGASAFQSMMLSGTIPQFFQSIFAVLSAVYFFVYAKDAEKASGRKFLVIAPVGWAGFRLVHRFVEQISYVRVSELLLELVLLALLVMFFMAFAQTASGVYVKNARWRIVGLGLPAALVSLTLNVPRLLFALTKGTDTLYAKYPFRLCDFVFAMFAIVLVARLIKNESEPTEV